MTVRLGTLLLFATLLRACASGASADTVHLQSGARITGAERDENAANADTFAITTPHGQIELARSQVTKFDRNRPADDEYRRRTPSIADTVDAQYAHAMWCRDNGLGEETRRHLRRVVRLAPDHAEARKLLGYNSVDGRWLTRDQLMEARGMIRWEGAYRTRQDIALIQRRRRLEAEQIAWRRKLASWRDDLVGRNPETARAAEASFETLTDPMASAELIRLLKREGNPLAKRRLIETLGRLATNDALVALADVALVDPDPNARAEAIDQIAASNRPGLMAPFVGALRQKDNVLINRGGEALATLGNDSVLDALVDALVTTHKRVIGSNSGGQNYDINTASGVFAVGGAPREQKVQVRNPGVHSALVALTGENFVFDQQRWREWLASRQIRRQVDLRRDN